MSDYEFELPLKVMLPRKTKKDRAFYVNMNTFTGVQSFTYNEAKKNYRDHMEEQLTSVEPPCKPIRIAYEYYSRANNEPDLSNFVSAGIKFFEDAMVHHEFIVDDNINYIPAYSARYMGKDGKNPRIVAKVYVVDE